MNYHNSKPNKNLPNRPTLKMLLKKGRNGKLKINSQLILKFKNPKELEEFNKEIKKE